MSKSRALYISWLLILSPLWISVAVSQGTQKTITKISTRIIEPNPASASFTAQPKIIWRTETQYARIAESNDVHHHIHALMIVNEPDVWMINLFDKSGRHMIDSGPPEVQIPIFAQPGETNDKLVDLEFGRDLQFFSKNHANQSAGEMINGKMTDRYEMTVSGRRLILWTDPESQKPVRISMVEGRKTQTLEYLSYETHLPFDPCLFRPPDGVRIVEAK